MQRIKRVANNLSNIKIGDINKRIHNRLQKEIPDSIPLINQPFIEAQIINYSAQLRDSLGEKNAKYIRTKRRLKNLRHGIKSDYKLIATYNRYISKYKVEYYKKYCNYNREKEFYIHALPLFLPFHRLIRFYQYLLDLKKTPDHI